MAIKLKPLDQQVVVVFGASSGIGRQAALDMAARGARIVAAARGDPGLHSLVEEIQLCGGQLLHKSEVLISTGKHSPTSRAIWSSTRGYIRRRNLFARVEDTTPRVQKHIEVTCRQIHG